jgi:hypothetical protein
MNEPTPENDPSYVRTQIAALRAILDTFKQLNPQEKAEAEKLKIVLDRLTKSGGSGGFTSTEGIRPNKPASPDLTSSGDPLPPPERLSPSDLGL